MTMAVACALLPAAALAGLPDGCGAVRDKLDQSLTWNDIGPGIRFAKVGIGQDGLSTVTLIRYSVAMYRTRPFAMKQLADMHRTAQVYSPPSYSLAELRQFVPGAALLASAGTTKSFSDPVPAGWLRTLGRNLEALAPKDRTLDGVVCLVADGKVSILGVAEAARRLDYCEAGFQAGPLLVLQGKPTGSEFKGSLSRVIIGITGGDVLLGYSPSASTALLGCALTAPKVGVVDAINLQGHTMGGISLSDGLSKAVSNERLGNVDALIASAIIVEPRTPQKRK